MIAETSHSNPIKESEHLITLKETSLRLGVSKRAVYRLIANGTLPPAVKVGGASRLYESDIDHFLKTLKDNRNQRTNPDE